MKNIIETFLSNIEIILSKVVSSEHLRITIFFCNHSHGALVKINFYLRKILYHFFKKQTKLENPDLVNFYQIFSNLKFENCTMQLNPTKNKKIQLSE